MPIVNYVREHIRFIEYAADEHLSGSEMLLWYALMHIMNQRAQGNVWPDEFIRISNDRLLSYCPMKFDTMANARNGLKQRGLIEFTKGEKNKLSPAYRMIYFYPQFIPPETERDGESNPKNTDNIGGNMGYNIGGNMGYNTGGNMGDFNINNTGTGTFTMDKPGDMHTQNSLYCIDPASRARGRMYTALDGTLKPCRYDLAWMTSLRARGAVAQRIIDKLRFRTEDSSMLHNRLMEYMDCGMPPETIEDAAELVGTVPGLFVALDKIADQFGLTDDAKEWRRCMAAAGGKTELAKLLYKDYLRSKEDKDE